MKEKKRVAGPGCVGCMWLNNSHSVIWSAAGSVKPTFILENKQSVWHNQGTEIRIVSNKRPAPFFLFCPSLNHGCGMGRWAGAGRAPFTPAAAAI